MIDYTLLIKNIENTIDSEFQEIENENKLKQI